VVVLSFDELDLNATTLGGAHLSRSVYGSHRGHRSSIFAIVECHVVQLDLVCISVGISAVGEE